MPSNNRGGNSSRSRSSNRSSGVMDLARERPIAAAAVAAGAAAAGLFLWSKRSQISDQLSNLSDQLVEWTENMSSGISDKLGSGGDDTGGLTTSAQSGTGQGMSETGGGNASLGRNSGGGGIRSNASGRSRAQSTAATQE
jgi:hypothetical protein